MSGCYWVKRGLVNKHFRKFSSIDPALIRNKSTLFYTEQKTFNLIHLKGALEDMPNLVMLSAFVVEKQFIGAGRSIKVKSLIKLSGYTMKEGSKIMGDEIVKT